MALKYNKWEHFLIHNEKLIYCGDLSSELVLYYYDHGDFFGHQMVSYSDAQYSGSLLLRSPFG